MRKIISLLLSLLLLLGSSFMPAVVLAAAALAGGDVFMAFNNTKQDTPSWVDPLNNADVRNVIEYRVKVTNDGPDMARNVRVRVDLPNYFGNREVATVHITSDNAPEITDTSVVNLTGVGRIDYLAGHARYIDSAGEHALPDSITGGGIVLGDILSGNSKAVQVMFKAVVIPQSTPTPTPTPTPAGATSSCVSLSASPADGTAPLLVRFSGAGFDSAGSIQQYEFNFGDASGGQAQLVKTTSNQASHRYEKAGVFIASVLVKDSRGVWLGAGDTGCQVTLNVSARPQVLAAETPKTLPKTGLSALVPLVLSSLAGLGVYFYRRFRLIS